MELLDNDLIEVEEQRSIFNWTAIILLWVGIGWCIANGYLGSFKNTVAIILLFMTSFVMYKYYPWGIKMTFGLLLMGALSTLDFFPYDIYFEFGVSNIGVGIDLIFILIGAIHVLTNKKEASKFLGTVFKPSEEEAKSIRQTKMNSFKKRFASRNIGELKTIAANDKLIPEAREAAKELLKEKTDTN